MNLPRSFKIPFVFFLVVYFFYLVAAKAPAAWAVWLTAQAVPGIWMSSPKGSIWQGEASAAQVPIANQEPLALGHIEWTLSPWSLLMMKPCLNFTTSLPRQTVTGNVCQGLAGTTEIKNLNLDAPITTLKDYLPVEMSGDISVQIIAAKFSASGQIHSLNARYSWQRARTYFDGNWLTLGSYAGTAKENGSGGVQAELFELEGPFKVALTGELSDFKKAWQIQGTVSPQKNAPEMIVQGLKILGEDLGDGSYKVQWP